eukprot:gene7371-11693_t
MEFENNYSEGEVIFSSSKTVIHKGSRKTDSLGVIIKKSSETVVSLATTESFKKDFEYTKMLYEYNDEYFLNMLEIVELTNGSLLLVEEDEGLGLQNLLQEKVTYEPKEFLKLAEDMTKALHHAHTKQVLHRDIKLANFIVSKKNNKPKLIDFDVAQVYGWTLILKGKINEEVKKIGGMKKIVNAKTCEDKELSLFLRLSLESLDIIFLAPGANPLMFITGAMISLYYYLTEGLPHVAPVGIAIAGWIYSFFFKESDGYVLTTSAEVLHSLEKNPTYNVVCLHYILAVGSITGGNFQKQQYHLNTAVNHAMTHGEYLYGAYSINSIPLALNGDHFPTLYAKMKKHQKWTLEIKSYFASDFLEVMINFVGDLCGISKYNPQYSIPTIRQLKCGDSTLPAIEGILNYHKGLYDIALGYFNEAEPVGDNSQGLFDFYERKFYHCMTLIAIYKKSKDEKTETKIKECLKDFKIYGDLSPEYLSPKYKLMVVYFESTQQIEDKIKILSKFEEVYQLMSKLGLVIPSAVTTECTLEFALENDFPMGVCRMYFGNALKIWTGLAAKTKVDILKKKYSKFSNVLSRKSSASITNSTTNATTIGNHVVTFNCEDKF